MESRSYAVLAVSFLGLFVAGIVIVVLWLHRGKPEDQFYDIVSPYSVSGLQVEAEVRFKGLLVGHVKAIRFDPENPNQVLVRIAVYPHTYITRSTYAELSYQGLTGLANISLVNSNSKKQQPLLATSASHPARIPMHEGWLQVLASAAQPDFKQAGEVLSGARQLLNEENRRHVARILARLDEASRRLVALEKSLAPTVQALPGVAAQGTQVLRESRRLLAQARTVTGEAPAALNRVGEAAGSVKNLGDASQKLVRELSRTVLELDGAIARIERTSRDVDQLSRELQREPQSVLFGRSPPPPGPGEPGFHPPPVRKP